MRTMTTATIGFPSVAPVEGHFASLAALIDMGCLGHDGDYVRALEKAGFVVVQGPRGPSLDIAHPPRGAFADGVGSPAETLLEALASEGFEGVLRDSRCDRAWYLSGGRCVSLDAALAMTA